MKYFLSKQQIDEIIEAYSVRKNEFLIRQDISTTNQIVLMHKKIEGYMLVVAPEIEKSFEAKETGRIIVEHTNSTGHIAYRDVWTKELKWQSRNPANIPLSDPDYVKDLEEEIFLLKKLGRELKDELAQCNNNKSKSGRKPKFTAAETEEICKDVEMGIPIAKVAKKWNTTRKTVYKLLSNR